MVKYDTISIYRNRSGTAPEPDFNSIWLCAVLCIEIEKKADPFALDTRFQNDLDKHMRRNSHPPAVAPVAHWSIWMNESIKK